MMIEMKSPMHPGEVVALNLEELGISISAAARGLGITRQQLHKVLAGTSAVPPEMAVKLEAALGSTAETWLRMQVNYDLSKVRDKNIAANVKRFEPRAA
jgi:addiction module HigA family antidote